MKRKIAKSTVWREIPGFPDYEAGNLGEIRSLDAIKEVPNRWGTITFRLRVGRVLKHWINKKGYHYVNLGAETRKEVHYWVAVSFLGPRLPGMEVNHKDGNKSNNAIDNLEWSTRSHNIQHAFNNALNHSGSKHGVSKLNEEQVAEIKALLKNKQKWRPPYYTDIANKYGVDRKTIESIAENKTWRQV